MMRAFIRLAIILGLIVNTLCNDLDLYKIVWLGPPTGGIEDLKDDNVIRISTQNKERYLCIVPDNGEEFNTDTSARNSTKEKDETPFQILEQSLQGNYCSYKFEVYWIYELCHGKYLRQYHEENNKYKPKITQEYYLGRLEPEMIKAQEEQYNNEMLELGRNGRNRPTIMVNGQHKPYVKLEMSGGTKCDLTDKKRLSTVYYVCNEFSDLGIHSIKEISTCQYEAIVLSKSLCEHKDFKTDVNTEHEVKCYALDGSPTKPQKIIEREEEERAKQQEIEKESEKISDRHQEEEEDEDKESKPGTKRAKVAYIQGGTIIVHADDLFT